MRLELSRNGLVFFILLFRDDHNNSLVQMLLDLIFFV
jgi:hypothetical protein